MESSGPPPRSDEPGQDQPSIPGTPGGRGAGDDPPLPSWYRPPSQQPPAGDDPPAGDPAPFRWGRTSDEPDASGEEGAEGPPPSRPGEPASAETPPGPAFDRPGAQPPPGPGWQSPADPDEAPGVAPEPPGPAFDRPSAGAPGDAEPAAASAEPSPTTGDAAPLSAAGAAGAAAAADVPLWSRTREAPEDATATPAEPGAPESPPPPPAYPQAAIADAWTTQPAEPTAPRWAPRYARGDRAHVFGDRMAAGVLLTLAAGSMIGGGIYALLGGDVDSTIRLAICGVVAAVLIAGAILLRFVRGSEDLRGTLAITGIAFAAACLAFAYTPAETDPHTVLGKFALVAGLVTVLAWLCAIAVPSAVAGLIGVIALGASTGAGIWLLVDQPTMVEVFVAALGIGVAVALVLPRIALLRPHPAGLGWALGGAALVVAVPAIGLMARDTPFPMAAGATASAALLAVAQRHRNLPAAAGAFAGLAYLEVLLVATRTGATGNSPNGTTQLIIVAIVGVALTVLVAAAAILERRARPWPALRRPWPVGVTDLLLIAALALAVISLFTANSGAPFTPTQLSPAQTATHVLPATPS